VPADHVSRSPIKFSSFFCIDPYINIVLKIFLVLIYFIFEFLCIRTLAEKFDKFPGAVEAMEKDRKKALLSLFHGRGEMKKRLGEKYTHFVPF